MLFVMGKDGLYPTPQPNQEEKDSRDPYSPGFDGSLKERELEEKIERGEA